MAYKTGRLRTVAALLAMGRPVFLGGIIPVYLLGLVLAWRETGALSLSVLLWGQLGVMLVQLMTHFSNEYWDVETDARVQTRTLFSGGSGAVVSRRVSRPTALYSGVFCGASALAVAGLLTWSYGTGPYTLLLFSSAILLAWFYSSPPLQLMSRGLGELDTTLISGVLVPFTAYYLQTGTVSHTLALACLPLVPLIFNVMLATEFPDIEADAQVGKRNLVVRLGWERAARLYQAMLLLALALTGMAWALGLPLTVVLWLSLSLPLVGVSFAAMQRREYRLGNWEVFCFKSVALFGAVAWLETLGFWLAVFPA